MRKGVPILVAVLAACGGADKQDGNTMPGDADLTGRFNPSNPDAPTGPSDSRDTSGPRRTAGELGLNCGVINAQQPQGLDMIGVTVGMPADQALAKIACSNPALRVGFSTGGGFQVPPPPDGGQMRTTIVANSASEHVTANLVGLPGQERVVTIRRTVRYSSGEEPALNAFLQQLERKYGPMIEDFGTGARNMAVGMARAPDGRPFNIETDQAQYARCMASSPGTTIYGDCGSAVRVVISPNPNNQQLVASIDAVMIDGAAGMRLIEEYTAVARRAQQQEAQDAAGRTPAL